ncbi:MAG: ribulose-phosphate 3-epimerase [Lachnospiraceae bacterium]
MNHIKLAPSILAADFARLGEQIKISEEAGATYLHFDVMDGVFVPSISFGMPVLQSIQGVTNQVYDVHLMITEPIRYVEEFAKAGADIITVHLEACEDIKTTLLKIKECGVKVGISISPDTPVATLEPLLHEVDMILIMSVHPGFGGQAFIENSLVKIRELRAMLLARNLEIDIEVDGGIYTTNVREVLNAGANVIVAGSAVFKGNPAENVRNFLEVFKEYE